MYNNKLYNTRKSGRFNAPGTFVPAGELVPGANPPPPPPQQQQQQSQYATRRQAQQQQNNVTIPTVQLQQPKAEPANVSLQSTDVDMSDVKERPAWMKSLAGVKKISNKERRRRQNENLRRLLSPKNALMVLNEMMPQAQISNQIRVELAAQANYYNTRNLNNFCADLTLQTGSYKGYGDNKLSARNAAAEQAFRDLIIGKMNKLVQDSGSQAGDAETEEEALPMIQLASFALHKLFTEWEYDGHKVPQLRPPATAVSEEGAEGAGAAAGAAGGAGRRKAAAGARELPSNAAALHPCTLLGYMRPAQVEYRELAVSGDHPPNLVFTVGVEVDSQTFIGKAKSKKEARKLAARNACGELFGVHFDEDAAETKPKVKKQE